MKNKSAFTLIEISVVVAIIGIIIGAVTVGQAVMQEARRMNIVTDYKKVELAVLNFYVKYGGYPGDISNASTLWPTCDGTPANCNGNANGLIDNGATLLTDEAARAWQQLTVSGILPGSYTGIHIAANDAIFFGTNTNFPLSRWNPTPGFFQFNNAGISIGESLNSLVAQSAAKADFLAAYDAYAIDIKVDDGLPQAGNVRASSTTTGLTGAAYTYSSSALCTMQFVLQTEK